MTTGFTFLDSSILILYFVIVLALAFYYSRKKDKNSTDYFLAGRSLGWFTIGISIFATNISSEHFVGLAGSGAVSGLAVGQFELMAIFTLIILGWFLAPIYMKSGVTTMPQFLEKRFDKRSRKFFATLSIVIYLFTKITVTLFAGGLLFTQIFHLNIYTSAIIIVLLTGLYSVIGGANAVTRTHVFQGIWFISGAVLLTVFGLKEAGGISGIEEKLPDHFFHMFKAADHPDFPWTGIIFGAPIIAFWYWCTDQYIVQRLLGANTIDDARRGSLLAAFLKILPIFILVLPGLIAVALFPDISGDEAYPMLIISNILPTGLKGFVVAGLLAAVMSSLSSAFNSTAALYTMDFYKPRHPMASERELVLVGRLTTTVVVVAAILSVPMVKFISSQIYLFLQSMQAFISPPITAVFLFGILNRKITASAAIWTLIIGEAIGFTRLAAEILINMGLTDHWFIVSLVKINFLHFAIILFGISTTLLFSLSYAAVGKPSKKVNELHYLMRESIAEIRSSVGNLNAVTGLRSNLILSAFIVLIIIGLWGIWN